MRSDSEIQPHISVIIPVRNGAATIGNCLRSIKRSYFKDFEVIVVDDHSTDATPDIARQHQCRLVAAEEGSGANAARNLGASLAKGEIFVFIDSDVVINRETLLGIAERLEEEGVDAVVGIYTAKHRHETLVSQYKNLWVRYSYIKSPPAIDWLFGAISGIRRKAFENLGGFDSSLLAQHGNDDIEAGKRLAKQKVNIVLDMDIEVEHLKHYTLRSFLRNEFNRSAGFAELAMNLGETKKSLKGGFVNVYPLFVISTALSIPLVAIVVGVTLGVLPSWTLLPASLLYLLLNIRFLNYLEQVRGLFAMMVMTPFLLLDHVTCMIGSVVGIVRALVKGKSSSPR